MPVLRSLFAGLVLAALLAGPAEARLDAGRPACDYCRMLITEQAFGVTATLKGGSTRIYDAIECAAAAVLTDSLPARRLRTLTFVDHDAPHRPLPLARTVFLHCPSLESPMGQSLFALASRPRAAATAAAYDHTVLDWRGVLLRVNQAWFQGQQPMARALAWPPPASPGAR